jgi:flagellar hook-length control protein FliK
MSSTSSITISLQASTPKNGINSDNVGKNRDLNQDTYETGFDAALTDAQSNQSPDTGKDLPREELARDDSSDMGDAVQLGFTGFQTQKVGRLNLLLAPEHAEGVSDQSLIAFMQDQGFSRADMAQLLMAKREGQAGETHSTADWLKTKGSNALGARMLSNDELLATEALKSTNLADALAAQLIEPRQQGKISAIVEIFAMKAISPQIKSQVISDVSDQVIIKLSDLLPSLMKKPVAGGANQGGSTDSGSFLPNQLDAKGLAELAKGPEMRDFREFLSEHLRRAESLRELTDKLGTMIARQIAGQIGRGRWSLEIAMHPAELGSIGIDMEMTERGLEASFRASHATTRDLLMESMPRLKSWFEEGGIDVAYAGLNHDSEAQNGGNSTGEDHAPSDAQVTESDESSDLADNQLISGDSIGLDIRV